METFYGGVIMSFNFSKVTAIVCEIGRPTLGRLFTKQNKASNVVASDRKYQGSHDVGMYGLLVSTDDTHRR
jgi:hypothetical protein